MQLALGTVQLGLDYGIANQLGKVSLEESLKIINLANNSNICLIDTAQAYGNSEEVIGHAQKQFNLNLNIVTKITVDGKHFKTITEKLKDSFYQLKCNEVYGVLLHDVNELLGEKAHSNYQKLKQLKEDGYCHKIGVSVYDPAQLVKIVKQFPIDIVQVPFNIFDQRFATSELIELYRVNNIEIHSRSLFLQGLLLMGEHKSPEYFNVYQDELSSFHQICREYDVSPLYACLAFVNSQHFITHVVIGVTSTTELKQITELANTINKTPASEEFLRALSKLSSAQLGFIDPSLWAE